MSARAASSTWWVMKTTVWPRLPAKRSAHTARCRAGSRAAVASSNTSTAGACR